ncbi:MAG: anti-sigma factor [Pyrinomonadaceae bacterium]
MEDIIDYRCQLEDVAAYLDGELSGLVLDKFEQHVSSCAGCATQLRSQRQLLCTLDVAFNDSRFQLPNDFARVVTAHAENDLTGMRDRRERRRAVQLCAILALVSFGLLRAATRAIVLDPLRSFFRAARVLMDLVWQATSEAASSAAVLTRVVVRAMLLAQTGSRFFFVLTFLFSISFLYLLIANYHRAQIIE